MSITNLKLSRKRLRLKQIPQTFTNRLHFISTQSHYHALPTNLGEFSKRCTLKQSHIVRFEQPYQLTFWLGLGLLLLRRFDSKRIFFKKLTKAIFFLLFLKKVLFKPKRRRRNKLANKITLNRSHVSESGYFNIPQLNNPNTLCTKQILRFSI